MSTAINVEIDEEASKAIQNSILSTKPQLSSNSVFLNYASKQVQEQPYEVESAAQVVHDKDKLNQSGLSSGSTNAGPVSPPGTHSSAVIMIGDAGVGKTCLSFRFCNNRFPDHTEATIGVDFRERTLALEGELIRVQLWDTAGQERYRQSIVTHYYRNVNAVVFVYDVSSPQSFKSLPVWINECKRHGVSSNEVPHILIGNKVDLSTPNRVKTDDAQIFADKNDMALFETSALSQSEADHVEAIFMTLVHKLQQCKPMHVQSDEERQRNEQRLLLKAGDLPANPETEGWCC